MLNDLPIVREVNGEFVLDSPTDLAIVNAVQRHNCLKAIAAHRDRIAYFSNRLVTLNLDLAEHAIVLLSIDDPNGKALADHLMPGHDWQAYRDRGEEPWARGFVKRDGLRALLEVIAPNEAQNLNRSDLVVVIMAFNCVLVQPC